MRYYLGEIELAESCQYCGGSGSFNHEDNDSIPEGETRECGECDGQGLLLSTAGEGLVQFLKAAKRTGVLK